MSKTLPSRDIFYDSASLSSRKAVKQVQGGRRVSQGEGFNIIAFSVVLRVKINLILIRIWAFDVNIKYKCPFFYSTVTDFARFLG